MKKQNSLYRMTTSEMQIMTYLWNSKEPAIASQTYSRKFAPKVSRAEYLAMQVMNELPDQELPEFLEFFQGKVG